MKTQELMTESPATATVDDTARRVAELMADNDCGCVPIVDAANTRRIVGVITDRDIAVRAVAKGKGPDTRVRELMTSDPLCCTPDTDVRDLEQMMADRQVRRILIVDESRAIVGIVSQADLARAAERGREVTEREIARVVQRISEPDASTRARRAQATTLEQEL